MAADPTPCVDVAVPDRQLVRQTLRGDRGAYAALVRRYERAVRATALAQLNDFHLAEDAAQEAFVRAYHELSRLKDGSAFAAWLLTIARRLAVRAARNRRRLRPLEAAGDVAAPSDASVLDERQQRLLGAIVGLPKHEAVAVQLRYFQGLPVGQIALITGRPLGTVTKQLSRAHDRLRRALKESE